MGHRIFFAAILFSPVLVAASLDGYVTDAAGHPIRKAGVTLRGGSPPSAYSTATDTDGSFAFSELNPGAYTLSVDRAGYIGKQYHTGPQETVSTITLAAGQDLKNVNLTLVRAVTISGTVLDEDGDPMAGAPVRLLQRKLSSEPELALERTSFTDSSGKYVFPDLPPGRHYVSAGPEDGHVLSALGMRANTGPALGRPAEYYANTWYPGATDRSGAGAIEAFHEDRAGIDIRLLKTPAFLVSGRVTGAVPAELVDQGPGQVVLIPAHHSDTRMNSYAGSRAHVAGDGAFDFRGERFPPGEYFLIASIASPGKRRLLASRRLTVGADTGDAVLNLEPLIDVHGHVAIEGEATANFGPRPGQPPNVVMQVDLSPAIVPMGPASLDVRSTIAPDGSFTLSGVAPGSYEVRTWVNPDKTWMKSMRLGSVEAVQGRIEITEASAATPLQLTLARSVGRIAGLVRDDRGNPAGGAVTLFRDPCGPDSAMMMSGVGSDGRLLLSPVAPGTYRVYAWEDIMDAQSYDPDLLKAWESSSVVVTVNENGSEEVTLKRIPSQLER